MVELDMNREWLIMTLFLIGTWPILVLLRDYVIHTYDLHVLIKMMVIMFS